MAKRDLEARLEWMRKRKPLRDYHSICKLKDAQASLWWPTVEAADSAAQSRIYWNLAIRMSLRAQIVANRGGRRLTVCKKKADSKSRKLEAELQDSSAKTRLQSQAAQLKAVETKSRAGDARIAELEAELQGALAAAQSAATKLDDAANQLKKKDAEIATIESDLRDSEAEVESKSAELEENKMRPIEEPEIMRINEPMGFYVDPRDTTTGVRLLTAIACVGGMPDGYEPHVYYRINEQKFIDTLVRSGDYTMVGEAKYSSADWTSEEEDIEKFYTRDEVMTSNAYRWIEDKDWVTNEMAWFASLQAYCSEIVNQ